LDNWFGHLKIDGLRVLLCNNCVDTWGIFWTENYDGRNLLEGNKNGEPSHWRKLFDRWLCENNSHEVKILLS
jgi:hypothetical protein